MSQATILAAGTSGNLRLIAFLERGVRARVLKDLARILGVHLSALASAVSIPQRTLDRRIAQDAFLQLEEADRTVRVARLFAKAKAVFEDQGEAAEWFRTRLAVLGGHSPLELCKTEPGAREVEQTLGRIDHGVFA